MHQSKLDQEWLLDNDIIHLNHAAVAPWPARTRTALHHFIDENLHIGSRNYIKWMECESRLRKQLKTLINAPDSKDIALLKSTSEGLSTIAYGLEWNEGDEIVICNEEFPSNRIVWESLEQRFGVRVISVEITLNSKPEEALLNACTEKTKLLSVSSVQYASGLRMPLEILGKFCQQNKILFCIDAIQSLGALCFDVQQYHSDFVVADAHKWMLGPEGIALFYVRESLRDSLKLNQFGWHMVKHLGDYDRIDWEVAASARRFECGSPNMLGIMAFSASLSLLEDVGMTNVEKSVLERSKATIEFIEQTSELDLNMRTEPQYLSGIVNFIPRHASSETVYNELQANKILCAMRGGGIRFSPHFYTPIEKIKKAVELAANRH